jgi:hypothetical protein
VQQRAQMGRRRHGYPVTTKRVTLDAAQTVTSARFGKETLFRR